MHTPYTKTANPSTPPSAGCDARRRPGATRKPSSSIEEEGYEDADYGRRSGAASTPPILEHYADIALADVIAERMRMKRDPAIPRYKYMAERDLTLAERADLERRRDEWHRWQAEVDAYEAVHAPVGAPIDGLHYAERFRVLTIYMDGYPDMRRTCAFAERHWPHARQVVVVSFDEDEMNYRKVGDRWESQWPDPRFYDDEERPWWHYIYGAH